MPLLVTRLLLRSFYLSSYRSRISERFGWYSVFSESKKAIWIHAVSVGEVQAAVPLINALRSEYPERAFVITTVTPTGAQRVQDIFGRQIRHLYLPFDLPGSVKRFLIAVDPVIAVIMETELWPNLFYQCSNQGIPIVIANARLSASSAQGYGRFKHLTEDMLSQIALIAAQTDADASRFRQLGHDKLPIEVTGSIKFDMRLPASLYEHSQVLRRQLMFHRPVWIAASTHEGEEEDVFEAFLRVLDVMPNTVLVLVPRHPDRSVRIQNLCRKYRLNFVRRSKNEMLTEDTTVYIGDTLGELTLLFAISDVAFVGGSLIKHGGHNMLEPAALGVPVVTGPYTHNFTEITKMMCEAGAATVVHDSDELAKQVLRFLQDANLRHSVGEAGKRLVEGNKGATNRLLKLITTILD